MALNSAVIALELRFIIKYIFLFFHFHKKQAIVGCENVLLCLYDGFR